MDKLDKLDTRLIAVGEKVTRRMRYSRDDIARFSHMTLDENPLHLDSMVAQRARFGEIVASGQQTSAILMGMLATHYSRSDDGVARQMICLNMNFAFKAPVFAEQEIVLQWQVSSVTPNAKLKGLVGLLDGHASVVPGKPSVVARGTILVSSPA
jgi:acyl dehydratase